jgi:ABC-2 type transport system permease protein
MPEAAEREGEPEFGIGEELPDVGAVDHVLAVARYEAGTRARGALVLLGLLVALATLDLAFFPSMTESGVDLDAYFESLPPAMQEAFGGAGLGTIEGFLVAEFYQFAWVLALGMYLAYRAGGLLAGDVERDRMDLLLAAPVSRRSVVLGKFLSLVPVVVLLNAVVPVVVYVGVGLVGESISAADLAAVHLLSIPYLLACAALGLLLSAVASRADPARRAGMGLVFAMYLLESVTARTDYESVGALTLQRYYDTAPVLTEGEYDLAGAAVLLAVTAVLLALAAWWFGRRDL